MARFPSPVSITEHINNNIDLFSSKIEICLCHPKWGRLFLNLSILVIATLYICYYFFITKNPWLDIEYNPSFFEMRYFWILPTLTPALLLAGLISDFLKIPVPTLFIGVFSVFAVALPFFVANSSVHIFPILTTLALLLILSLHFLFLLITRRLTLGTRILFLCLVEYAITYFFNKRFEEGSFLKTFWLFQPYRYIFIFSILAGEELLQKAPIGFNKNTFSFVFNPTNFITPLPIPFNRWIIPDKNRLALQARSLIFLSISLFTLTGYAGIHFILRIFTRHSHYPIIKWFVGGGLEYIYYFLFSYSNITIPVALLWWFGFNLPDAYNVPLLATSPQDRWRRWNTYFYNWYFQFVFFPIFKLTRSSFTAIMVTFGLTMYIHLAERVTQLYPVLIGSSDVGLKTYKRILFFLFHGLLVYFGIKLEKIIPSGKSQDGWIAVGIMFVIMSFLHGIFVI